jgi:peptidase E
MIAGLNIEAAHWEPPDTNTVGLKDLTAMGFVPLAIAPHYNNKIALAIKNAAMEVKYPVVALTDAQAVMVDGDKIKIIGLGEKIVFNNSIGL